MDTSPVTPRSDSKTKFRTPRKKPVENGDIFQLITPVSGSSNKVIKLPNEDFRIRSSEKSPELTSTARKNIKQSIFQDPNIRIVGSSAIKAEEKDKNFKNSIFDLQDDFSEINEGIESTPIEKSNQVNDFVVPKTPEGKNIVAEPEKVYEDSDDDDDVWRIQGLKNPFGITTPTTKLVNPFISNHTNNNVDYANTLELVDHKTGKKFIQKLSSSQKRIKPKKLNFNEEGSESTLSFNDPFQNHKFMERNFGKLVCLNSKKSLNFEIFSDADKK